MTRFGYSATPAPTGAEALEKLDHEELDGIFLDIHLYDMDGRVIYQKVKERSGDLASRTV